MADWTPEDSTTPIVAWFDAADEATVIHSSGAVTAWNDKSGNDFHATELSAALRPNNTATINTLPAIGFVDDALALATERADIRAVMWVSADADGSSIVNTITPIFSSQTSNQDHTFIYTNIEDYDLSIDGAVSATGGARYNGGDRVTGGNIDLGVTGLGGAEAAAQWYADFDLNTKLYNIGRLVTSSSINARITMGEMLFFSSVPTDAQRQLFEGYLAHKWGLQSDLPTDHPYRSIVPQGPDAPVLDPLYNLQRLALSFNGVNGATESTDTSPAANAVTFHNGASLDDADSVVGETSLLLDGVDNFVSVGNAGDFDFIAQAKESWTIEFYFKFTAVPLGQQTLLDTLTDQPFGKSGFYIDTLNNRIIIGFNEGFGGSTGISADVGLSTDVWYHYAATHTLETKLTHQFINGYMVSQGRGFGNPIASGSRQLHIGAQSDDQSYPFEGRIERLEIIRGFNRYERYGTSVRRNAAINSPGIPNFYPPMNSLGNVHDQTLDPLFERVDLLVHANGTDGSVVIPDTGPLQAFQTVSGGAQLDTAVKKFGSASVIFGAAGDAVNYSQPPVQPFLYYFRYNVNGPYLDRNNAVALSNAYVIEGHVRFATVPGAGEYAALLSKRVSPTSGNEWSLWYGGTEKFYFEYSTDGTDNIATSQLSSVTPDADEQYHFALVFTPGEVVLFIDGVKQTPLVFNATLHDSGSLLTLGSARIAASTYISTIDGFLDEVRLTRGFRYLENFSPPTQEFPEIAFLLDEINLGLLADTETLQPIVPAGSKSLATVSDAEQLFPLSTFQPIGLTGNVEETETLYAMLPQGAFIFSTALDSETLFPLSVQFNEQVSLPLIVETETAFFLGDGRQLPLLVGTESTFDIAVSFLPVPVITPESVNAEPGDVFTFTLDPNAPDQVPYTVQWYDQNGPIQFATELEYVREFDLADDAESIYAIVTNVTGAGRSNDVPMTITEDALEYVLRLGTYREPFYKNGTIILNRPLNDNESLSIERKTPITNEVVFNQNLTPDWNAFEYQINKLTMVAQEIEGHRCDCRDCTEPVPAIEVTVNDVFQGSGETYQVVRNDAVVLSASVERGFLPVSYQWQKNGVNISGATGPEYSFTATSVGEDDLFSVVLTNICGDGADTVRVQVNSQPTEFACDSVASALANLEDEINAAWPLNDPQQTATIPENLFRYNSSSQGEKSGESLQIFPRFAVGDPVGDAWPPEGSGKYRQWLPSNTLADQAFSICAPEQPLFGHSHLVLGDEVSYEGFDETVDYRGYSQTMIVSSAADFSIGMGIAAFFSHSTTFTSNPRVTVSFDKEDMLLTAISSLSGGNPSITIPISENLGVSVITVRIDNPEYTLLGVDEFDNATYRLLYRHTIKINGEPAQTLAHDSSSLIRNVSVPKSEFVETESWSAIRGGRANWLGLIYTPDGEDDPHDDIWEAIRNNSVQDT